MATFDYTSRDFTNIKSDLLSRARAVAPDWTSRDPSDFGMLLIDLWSQMGDVLHYYVDRTAAEAFLPSATQRESVLAYASLFGYQPYGRQSSTGTVTLLNTGNEAVTIPAYTSFVARDGNNLFYFYTLTNQVVASYTESTIDVVEGTRVDGEVLTTSANGDVNQRYTLAYDKVVPTSVEVYVYENFVSPTRFFRVDKLLDANPGSKVFRTKLNASEYTEVIFGGNSFGTAPQVGAKITASYTYSSGALGNLSANSIFGFTGTAPAGITIVASSAMTGGQNSEPISVLRSRIPTSFAPQGRAVTLTDYANIARSSTSVAKVTASYTSASAGNASVTVYPQVDRSSDFLTTSDASQVVSAAIEEEVLSLLIPRKMLGVDVVVAPTISWTPIYISATIYVTSSYYASEVQSRVTTALSRYLGFNNILFGQILDLGTIYRVILNTPGLDYATITKFNTDDSSDVLTTIQIASNELPKITIGSSGFDTVFITTSGGIDF